MTYWGFHLAFILPAVGALLLVDCVWLRTPSRVWAPRAVGGALALAAGAGGALALVAGGPVFFFVTNLLIIQGLLLFFRWIEPPGVTATLLDGRKEGGHKVSDNHKGAVDVSIACG